MGVIGPLVAGLVIAAGPVWADEPPPDETPLTLAAAVARAAEATPAVEIAALRRQEADARRGQARAALTPSLSGSAFAIEHTFSTRAMGFSFPGVPNLVGPVDAVDARLRATQTLFDASSWMRLRASGHAVDASRAEAEGTAETAAQQAALAYVRAARTQAVVGARRSDLELARALMGLAQEQSKAGTAVAIDLSRARTQEAAARGALLIANNQADRAAIDLARALGLEPTARLALADTLGATLGASAVPEAADSAVAQALVRRPELAAERARRARARADLGAITAERLPRLDVSADYGLSGDHPSGSIPTRQIAVQATVPLFDGLRRERRAAEQSAMAREAEVRVRDLERQIAAEVRSAALDLGAGREQESVALERVGLAEEELAQARERFASGVASNIEVIEAQASLLRARDAVIDARTAVALARVALARAAGAARTMR